MKKTSKRRSGAAVRCGDLVRPACDIQSENGVALLLSTVLAQNHQSPTARPMKVTEIVRDVVRCPKCFDLFLAAHADRLRACLKILHDQWKLSGEPDLGECLVEQKIDGLDYLMFAYCKMAERCWHNDQAHRQPPTAK